MSDKEKYKIFCAEHSLPLFLQYWWQCAVCAGQDWDVFVSQTHDGQVRAVMPYLLRRSLWMKYIEMPPQTLFSGIWLNEDVLTNDLDVEAICTDFKRRLDALRPAYFYQHFPIGSPCVQVFKKLGFSVSERVTYRLDDLHDVDALVQHFSKHKKREIEKADTLRVDREMNIEDFYRFHVACLQERRKKINYTRESLLVLYQRLHRENHCQLLRISDKGSNAHAAAMLVWDNEYLYFFIPVLRKVLQESGAGARLVLEAIKFAKEIGRKFDFAGSVVKSVATHYKQFAATPTPFYTVRKLYNPLLAPVLLTKHFRT